MPGKESYDKFAQVFGKTTTTTTPAKKTPVQPKPKIKNAAQHRRAGASIYRKGKSQGKGGKPKGRR